MSGITLVDVDNVMDQLALYDVIDCGFSTQLQMSCQWTYPGIKCIVVIWKQR